jgi:hypothetical protein
MNKFVKADTSHSEADALARKAEEIDYWAHSAFWEKSVDGEKKRIGKADNFQLLDNKRGRTGLGFSRDSYDNEYERSRDTPRERSRDRHRERSRERQRDRSRERVRERSRDRSSDRQRDRRSERPVKETRRERPSEANKQTDSAPAPQSAMARAIAEKLKGKGGDSKGGAADHGVRRAIDAVSRRDGDTLCKPQWERFDLNRANYEEETRTAKFDSHRQVQARTAPPTHLRTRARAPPFPTL